MREILFRAKTEPCSKDAISGKIELKPKWVYGYIDLGYMQDEKGAIISDEKAHSAYRCQYSTIGQYTGLKDRFSRRIFEGDIVRLYSTYHEELTGDNCVVEYGVFNCSCCDGVYGWEFKDGDIRDFDSYEIIGNIHDNPELLKEDV